MRFSVVIPAYNQAQFLTQAVQSVLQQTHRGFEVIIVDDGSTDDTPLVARGFGQSIRYIRQVNQGLGAARNAGIRHAQGEYVALLDSDDMWLPQYLETVASSATQQPNGDVYYCGWRYIDANGRKLPQSPSLRIVDPKELYDVLLKANFIVPSSVVARRSALFAAGLFDTGVRSLQGVEDWDLWLRLLQQGCTFVGSSDCLVHYRLHESSLSANPAKMQRAALAMMEKQFGPDNGRLNDWPEEKRLAYYGAYRYQAITSLTRARDWKECARHLRKALQVNPALALDLDLFYELALGTQPLGYRGTPYNLSIEDNADGVRAVLADVFDSSLARELSSLRRPTYGTAYCALGLAAYNVAQFAVSRQFLLTALRFRPDLSRDRRVVGDLIKSFVGHSGRSWLRQVRGTLVRGDRR